MQMLNLNDPYIAYVAVSYALTAVVCVGMVLMQRHHYRSVRRLLDQYKDAL